MQIANSRTGASEEEGCPHRRSKGPLPYCSVLAAPSIVLVVENKRARPGMIPGIHPDRKGRVEGGCKDQIEVDLGRRHAAAGR